MNEYQNRLSFLAKTPVVLLLAGGLFVAACGNGEADSATPAPAAAASDASSAEVSSEDVSSTAALGEMALGPADAPVTMIEYASLTCPACASFHNTTFKRLEDNFIDTGRIRYIFRDFPIDQFAMEASILARCAGEDKYFEVVDTLLENQQEWAFRGNQDAIRRGLRNVAEQYGVSDAQYDACLADNALRARITARMREGQSRFGVNSTPTIIIDGEVWEGSRAYTEIARRLIDLLPPGGPSGQ